MFQEQFLKTPGNRQLSLIQVCFTVSDLDTGVESFSRLVGAGPWYRVASLTSNIDQTTYRGSRSPLGADIALAYSGNTMFELVAPQRGSTSVFSEWVTRFGYGLHHFGYATEAFDQDCHEVTRTGKNPVMTSVTARGARVAMFESDGPTDTLHELIEITSESRRFYKALYAEAKSWTNNAQLYTDLKS